MDCGLFIALTPAEFAAAAGYFSISSIEKGDAIFNEGDAGTFMCIIHSGTVSVQKLNSDGQPVETAILRSGRAFGEMAVLDGERRSATCIAASSAIAEPGQGLAGQDAQRGAESGGEDHPRGCGRHVKAAAHDGRSGGDAAGLRAPSVIQGFDLADGCSPGKGSSSFGGLGMWNLRQQRRVALPACMGNAPAEPLAGKASALRCPANPRKPRWARAYSEPAAGSRQTLATRRAQ